MDKLIAYLIIIISSFALSLGLGFLLAFPTMIAWNYVVPKLFGLQSISWTEAWALNFLAGTFFKSTVTNKKD